MSKPSHAAGGSGGKGIDWPEIRRRLDATHETLASGGTPGSEETKEILRARARVLAQEPAQARPDEELLEFVQFMLAYERYGVETSFVREVYPLKELTPLPGVPPFVLGIINVRGKILSVLDLKKFFDLPDKGLTDLNKVIVLHTDNMEFGVLADVILGVKTISANALQPALPTHTGIREEYLRGLTPDRAVILDAQKLLTDDRMVVREEVEASSIEK
jgi:purine-binding chemotaxis protein CheW